MSGLLDNDEGSIDLESQVDDRSDSTGDSRNQSTAKDAEKSQKPQVKPVRMNFGERVVKQFQQDYGVNPILASSEPVHPHPHLAYQRNRLEEMALKIATKTSPKKNPLIWDVGSGARRHAHYRIHCLCPYLQPGDAERLNQSIRNGNSVCAHKLQDCTCGTPDILLFVHSAYYISVADMIKSIRNSTLGTAYVVGHCFGESYGSLAYGEAEYKLDLFQKSLSVIMKVKGNAHSYQHPPLAWDVPDLRSCPLPVVDGGQLDVELLVVMGDTKLWRVKVREADFRVPWEYGGWQNQLKDNTSTGVVYIPGFDKVTRQCAAANGVLSLEVDCVYGRGAWLFAETRTGKCYMPRGLIEKVALDLLNKPRDPASWQDCTYMVKRAIEMCPMPPAEKLRAATLAVALAFSLNVGNEVDVLHTSTSRFDRLWKMHAQLNNLVPIKVISVWVLLLLGLMMLLSFTLVVFMNPEMHGGSLDHPTDFVEWEGVPLLVLIGVTLLTCLCCCRYGCARYQSRRTADNWSSTLFHEERPGNITGSVSGVPTITAFPVFSGLRALLPVSFGAGEGYTAGPDPKPPKHPSKPRIGLHLEGIATSLAVPTAPRTDQEAEIVAMNHRLFVSVPDVDKSAYDKFMDTSSRLSGKLMMAIRVLGSPTMYTDWIKQTKFTHAVQEKFRKAYELKVLGCLAPTPGQFHAFVKFEKMKALTLDLLLEGLKVRLINGPPDAVKVAVGPWTARIQNALADAWDGRQCNVLYACGRTPDYIGKVLDEFASVNGGWENMIGVWDDMTTYDATCENELLAKRKQVYPAVGMPDLAMAWLDSVTPAGRTTHGCEFELGEKVVPLWDGQQVKIRKLFSGEMDTNLIGSIINAEAHESGIPQNLAHLMLVCGDDNFILFRKDQFDISVANDLKEHLELLGLRPTQGVSTNRADWEFCSKLFWFGMDRQSGRLQTVLGPKPGRWLHRIGWTVNTPNGMNFREAMLSSAQDVNHIPLLGEYVKKGIAVSGHMKRAGKEWSEMKHVSKMFDPCPENYPIIASRYGLGFTHLEEYQRTLEQVSVRQCVIDLPWIAAAAKRDEE